MSHFRALQTLNTAALGVVLTLSTTSCSDSGLEVVVELRTDLVPEIEFDSIETELVPAGEMAPGPGSSARRTETPATRSGDYFVGFRIAEFSDVVPGTYLIAVTALLESEAVAQRVIRVDILANSATRVILTRGCRGAACPGAGDDSDATSCVGGLCASPECVTGREPACPARECGSAGDCSAPAACASAACVNGLCLVDLDDTQCPAGERCHPDPMLGCVDATMCVPLEEICNRADDDCDGIADEDFDILTDFNHCGACGSSCDSVTADGCRGGTCECSSNRGSPCLEGRCCSTGCEPLDSVTGCGACGFECNADRPAHQPSADRCDGGGCRCGGGAACAEGSMCCAGTCVSFDDPSHCGTCGSACFNAPGSPASQICAESGPGSYDCLCSAPGRSDCDGVSSNGCETDTGSSGSVNNCGGCGARCLVTNGTPACNSGVCAIASCNSRYADCLGGYSNGCETRLASLTDCGGCGITCSLNNATATCAAGSCAVASCDAGWADCSGGSADGCETPINTLTNCGGCGITCSRYGATATCSSGSCRILSCNSGNGNCNGRDSDGCECATG
ncbi:MAG: hypothetical protein DRJ42_00345 [Deltaproteobacteria bacterium]|nr:MAG: hypothetical protein DRJ42_00345 [Deltaproteobacteria bacterium]